MIGGTGIIRHRHTYLEVCQDQNPTVTVARQDFRKCCICPHASDYGILVCSLCMTCMTTATLSWVCSQAFAVSGVRIHPHCEKLFIEFMVFFYYDVNPMKFVSLGLMVLVSFYYRTCFESILICCYHCV